MRSFKNVKNLFRVYSNMDDLHSALDNGHLVLYRKTFTTIVALMEARDAYTSFHSERVSEMAKRFCKIQKIPPTQSLLVEMAAEVHDIGKIGIQDSILNKPGKLSPDEFREIQKHPKIGADALLKVDGNLKNVANIVLAHHERWDGCGYPQKLKGDEIPIASRIIAICDSVDAMLSKRVYRPAMDEKVCQSEILKGRGKQYQPELADAFLSNWETIVCDIYNKNE